jgi:M6 family metalloprotease-like protein
MKTIKLVFLLAIFVSNISFATIFDLGTKTYVQPNGKSFTGWHFIDERGEYFVVEGKYLFQKNDNDNYYYYLDVTSSGDLFKTNIKVEIDDPIKNNIRIIFGTKEWREKHHLGNYSGNSKSLKKTSTTPTSVYLNVILVEFTDIKHQDSINWPKSSAYGTAKAFRPEYTKNQFETMLFSRNQYKSPITSPDLDPVYGSMADYYYDMSGGQFSLTGAVANTTNANGKPVWVRLGNTKAFFNQKSYYPNLEAHGFGCEAVDSLYSQQGISIDISGNKKVLVIYAGNAWGGGVLNPRADMDCYKYYVMSERKDFYSNGSAYENSANFSHIGIHCHEFGHLLGLPDRYNDPEGIKQYVGYWDLMSNGGAKGVYNGTNYVFGNCPAPMNPQDLHNLGWLTYDIIPAGKNLSVSLGSELNRTYKINVEAPIGIPEYYVIQNRQATVGVWNKENRGSGLLIWRIRDNGSDSRRFLRPADGNMDPDRNWEMESVPFPGTTNKRYANDFVNPTLVFQCLDSNSNIVIRNLSNSAATMTADINTYWCDSIKESITWSGSIKVGGNIIIPSGITLTISPGTNVQFASGKNMTIYGTLSASGSSSDSITFTSQNSSENWGGIVFSGSGAGGSMLSYCRISKVLTYGGAAVAFIDVSGSPVVQYCNISGNVNYGTSGLLYSNSNGYLMKNIISYNYNGVSCNSGATPMFGKPNYYFYCGSESNNKIIYNSNIGVSAYYSSLALGYDAISYVSGNSLYGNSYANLSASGSITVTAESVWWGASTPDLTKMITSGGASISYSPFCTYAPTNKISSHAEGITETGITYKINNGNGKSSNSNSGSQSEEAIGYIINGEYDKAKEIYTGILAASKDKNENIKAVYGLLTIYRSNLDKNIISYLESLLESKSDIKDNLNYILGNAYVVSDQADDAITKYQNVINEASAADLVKSAKVKLAIAYRYNKNDKDKANVVLYDLQNNSKYSADDPEIMFANWLINGNSNNLKKEGGSGQNSDNTTNNIPKSSMLMGNYPNPFNPSTKIKYSLSDNLKTTIKIYDIVGREIRTLVDEYKNKGNYEVTFDAKGLSSGVYFCYFKAGDVKQISKLIFAK